MTTGTGTGSGTETWLGTETGGGNGDDAGSKERAQHAASTAADEGKHVAGVVAEETKSVAGEAKDHARNLVSEARSQLQGQVDDQSRQQKDMLVGTLSTFGDDLASMAQNGSGLAADVAHQVAERASSLSRHLDGREPSELLDDVRRFARQRPGTFLLGALAAGVVVGTAGSRHEGRYRRRRGPQDAQVHDAPRSDPQCSRHHVGARQPRSADPAAHRCAARRPPATRRLRSGPSCRAPRRPGRREGRRHEPPSTTDAGLTHGSMRSGRRGRGRRPQPGAGRQRPERRPVHAHEAGGRTGQGRAEVGGRQGRQGSRDAGRRRPFGLVRPPVPQPRVDVPARQLAAHRGGRADHDGRVGGHRPPCSP